MITLRFGDHGPAVMVLQTWLNALNPYCSQGRSPSPLDRYMPRASKDTMVPMTRATPPTTLEVTGDFDGDTRATVMKFQSERGLRSLFANGTVDYLTWWELGQLVRNLFVLNPPGAPSWLVRLAGPVVPPRGLDSTRFLEGYTEIFNASGRVAAGLQKLLTYINGDAALPDLRWAAYMFATVHKECGPVHGFLPIPEDGCDDNRFPVCSPVPGNSRSYGDRVPCGPDSALLTKLKSETGLLGPELGESPALARLKGALPAQPCPAGKTFHTYYGRGYVQLTGIDNYRAMSKVTGLDLVHSPERVLDPDTAYQIMSHGMRNGTFTGARLSQYIQGPVCNYYDARNIINGRHDCASEIAGWAKMYEIILYYSLL